jgi:hypothetical protein
MSKKKVKAQETIEVQMYDDYSQEYYAQTVPKAPVSNCVLCGCFGCLSDKCCEHLEYWDGEAGRPARFQVGQLMDRIVRLEELIAKLEQNRKDVAATIRVVTESYSKRPYTPQEISMLKVLASALNDDIEDRLRVLTRKEDHLCDACSCPKCNERMLVAMRNKHNWDGQKPVPECCGHKEYLPSGLPF